MGLRASRIEVKEVVASDLEAIERTVVAAEISSYWERQTYRPMSVHHPQGCTLKSDPSGLAVTPCTNYSPPQM